MFIRTTKVERKMLRKSGLWFPRPFLFLHAEELEKHHAHAHEQHGAEYDETRARAIMRLVWEKKRRGMKGFWGLVAILMTLTALSVQSNGQNAGPFGALNPSHITTITFQNSSGTVLKTFAAPWVFKCSTNMTCSISGNVVTVSSAAGVGGSGYAIIQNGGAAIAAEGAINFLGSFSCVDNPGNTSSDCKLSTNAAVANQYLTGVDSSGNFIRKQIDYSELSGSAPVVSVFSRTGAVVAASGDYNASQITNAFDVTVANTLTAVAAPASPAAGKVAVYPDSTNLVLSSKNSSGTVSNTVVPSTCTNQVASAVSASGVITCHTVVSTDTSGTFLATAHSILSTTHSDTTAAAAVRGDGFFAIGATPTWQRLAHGGTGTYFKWNGTDIVASTQAASGVGTVAVPCSNQFITSITTNADALPTTLCATVARAAEGADARGWAFCGTATGSTTTVGPVSASTCCAGGLCTQFMVIYQINGYNGGTPVGRLLVANGTISTTALTNSFSVSENFAVPTTGSGATAIPGLPLAVTLSAIGRSGVIFIDGPSGQIKTMNIFGNEGTPSVATAPTLFRGASFFSDLGTNLALANFQLTVYDTLAAVAVSARAFTSGTYLMVLGRKTD